MTTMIMPETPVYEYNGAVFLENHIGCPGEVITMQAIPKSHSEETTAYL